MSGDWDWYRLTMGLRSSLGPELRPRLILTPVMFWPRLEAPTVTRLARPGWRAARDTMCRTMSSFGVYLPSWILDHGHIAGELCNRDTKLLCLYLCRGQEGSHLAQVPGSLVTWTDISIDLSTSISLRTWSARVTGHLPNRSWPPPAVLGASVVQEKVRRPWCR